MLPKQGETMLQIHEVIKSWREKQGLSQRAFAKEINKKLINTGVSHVTVSKWEKEERYEEPKERLLFECMATYRDWRAEWARDCLVSMFPDLFISGIVRIELPKAE